MIYKTPTQAEIDAGPHAGITSPEDYAPAPRVTPPLHTERHYDDTLFRVWPDGTVQCAEDGEPYSHMSDDYELVAARDEDEARAATQRGYGA